VFERHPGGLVLWMTDGPQEVSMMAGLTRGHRGHVLVTGLGLGIAQQRLLTKPGVERVTTLDATADVARLHEDLAWFADPRHGLVIGRGS
jgi:spermidine synthase